MSSNISAMDANSLNILNVQLIPSITWVVFGLFGSVGNFLLFFVISTNRKCRSNFYFCLMQVAIADTIYCLTALLIGLKRVVLMALTLPESCSPTACLWVFFPQIITKNVSLAQAAVVGFDRLLGVSIPVRYMSLKIRHLQVVNLVMWAFPTVLLTYQMIVSINPAPIIPSCAVGQIWLPAKFGSVSSNLGFAWEVLNMLIYSLLLAVLVFRMYASKNKGYQTIEQLKQSGQYRAAMTGFMILGVFTGVAATGDLFILGTGGFSPSDKSKYQPYGNTFSLLASNLNFLICVWRNEDVQRPILNILTCRRLFKRFDQIAPMSQISAANVQTINVASLGKTTTTTTANVQP